MELEPLASLRNPGVFCFSYFPLVNPGNGKLLGQEYKKKISIISRIINLLFCQNYAQFNCFDQLKCSLFPQGKLH